VHGLHEAFSELKTDMMEEVKDIDRKLVVPAQLARDALKPMEKAIKKRDDAKVRHTLPSASTPVLTPHG
jgi:amphiphysin